MNIHQGRPACYVFGGGMPSERGEVVEGWPDGVLPGCRNPFFDKGRVCGQALTSALWRACLEYTPGCRGCLRGYRGLWLEAQARAAGVA